MNIWFSRFVLLLLVVGLLAVVLSLIPLINTPRDRTEGAITAPDTLPVNNIHPPENVP